MDESRIEVRDDLPPGTAIYHEPNKYVCSLCFPDAKEIAEIGKEPDHGICLFECGGRYGLAGQPGHRDYVVLWFPVKPLPEPPDGPWTEDGNYVNQEDKERDDAWFEMDDQLQKSWNMSPTDGAFLIECCEAAGWDWVGIFSQWLIDWAGTKIKEWEAKRKESAG